MTGSETKTLQPRQYFDILFSFDGMRVDRLPAKLMNWPEDLRLKYSELKSLEKKTKEPLRDWNSTGVLEGSQRAMPEAAGTAEGQWTGAAICRTQCQTGDRGGKTRVLVLWAISCKDNAAVVCDENIVFDSDAESSGDINARLNCNHVACLQFSFCFA